MWGFFSWALLSPVVPSVLIGLLLFHSVCGSAVIWGGQELNTRCSCVKHQRVLVTEAEGGTAFPHLRARSLQQACSVPRSLQLSSGLQLGSHLWSSCCILCTVTNTGLVPGCASPMQFPLLQGRLLFISPHQDWVFSTVSSLSTCFFTGLSD